MKKEKLTSVVLVSMLILSTMMMLHGLVVPSVAAASVIHSASISPMTKILGTLPQDVIYLVNVTSKGTDFINKTCIKLPTGWTNKTVIPPTNWNVAAAGGGWLNFTTALNDFANGTSRVFNITATISMIPPTTGTWYIYCYKGSIASQSNPVSITVTVKLQFSSAMSPFYVKNGTSYIYTVTTTNDASAVGIKQLNITFPAGTWSFNQLVDYSPRTWTVTYDSARSTFKLTGPNILIGESVTIKVNMTVPVGAPTNIHYWNVSAWDSSGNYLGKYSIKAVIDASKPGVTIDRPNVSAYSVGNGKYIWINVTVDDTPSIEDYGITVTLNDTRFIYRSREKVSSTQYKYYFVNNTVIPDGKLAVKVTATDPAGNIGSAERSTTVDNTAPKQLWVKVMDVTTATPTELPFVGGIYWMGADTKYIQVKASFYDPAGASGTIYLNSTPATFNNGTSLLPSTPYNVTGSDYVTLKITLVDTASPTPNNFTKTWEIKRDRVKPSVPTYTAEAICGGVVIKGLNATDNVGVLKYKIYVNGSVSEVFAADLASTAKKELPSVPFAGNTSIVFSGTLILNLTVYAGKTINLTICTIDYGNNPSNPATNILSIPDGRWYPVVLQQGWNLISLPLVPANSSIENVLSLLLKSGTFESVWTYDAETGKWHSYAPGAPPDLTTMTDGKGYFIKVTKYNVLIIQGTEQPAPPALPRAYHVVPGWNLIGYKRIIPTTASDYLKGVEYIRIYKLIPGTIQLEPVKPTDYMEPGYGYWIAVAKEGWIYP